MTLLQNLIVIILQLNQGGIKISIVLFVDDIVLTTDCK